MLRRSAGLRRARFPGRRARGTCSSPRPARANRPRGAARRRADLRRAGAAGGGAGAAAGRVARGAGDRRAGRLARRARSCTDALQASRRPSASGGRATPVSMSAGDRARKASRSAARRPAGEAGTRAWPPPARRAPARAGRSRCRRAAARRAGRAETPAGDPRAGGGRSPAGRARSVRRTSARRPRAATPSGARRRSRRGVMPQPQRRVVLDDHAPRVQRRRGRARASRREPGTVERARLERVRQQHVQLLLSRPAGDVPARGGCGGEPRQRQHRVRDRQRRDARVEHDRHPVDGVRGKYSARYSRVRSSESGRDLRRQHGPSRAARGTTAKPTRPMPPDLPVGRRPGRPGQTRTGWRSEAIEAISSDARSNSSSDSTGVPSNGSSRVSSSHERQPPYSSRTLTVTGRGMR